MRNCVAWAVIVSILAAVLPVNLIAQGVPASALAPLLEADALGSPEQMVAEPIDRSALAAFVDGVVRTSMERDAIAGVTVAVVDAQSDLLLRGYGNAAIEPMRAVDPQTTLFRLGSISKTFTCIAAMQLAEQGKLDLQADANRYLPAALQLPDDGYPPIRVHHLLTHTAGFEDSALGHLFVFSRDRVLGLDDYLASHRPQRVRAPGTHAVYTNYAVALLGAIVAHVSGQSFDVYMREHLFAPLAMHATRFDETAAPAPGEWPWSNGFVRKLGAFQVKPFEYIGQLAPAGAASSTAADMARYMRMLLGNGALASMRVLAPETFAELVSVDFRNADAVGGIAHGFFCSRYGRHESLEHGGATLWFHSNLIVLPDAGLGVFVSTNTDSGRRLARELPRLVFEHLRADARAPAAPAAPTDFAARAVEYVGSYMSERRNFSTLEKFFSAFDSAVGISVVDDRYLLVDSGDGNPRRYVEEGALAFRSLDDGARIAFMRNAEGRISGFAGSYGHTVYERVGIVDAPRTLVLALVMLAFACVGVLLCAWRRATLPARMRIRDGRVSAALLIATSALWLIAWIVVAVALLGMLEIGGEIVSSYPTRSLRVAVAALHVAAGSSVLCALTLFAMLRARGWSFWRKLRHVVVILLMLAVIALLLRWNVLLAPLGLAA